MPYWFQINIHFAHKRKFPNQELYTITVKIQAPIFHSFMPSTTCTIKFSTNMKSHVIYLSTSPYPLSNRPISLKKEKNQIQPLTTQLPHDAKKTSVHICIGVSPSSSSCTAKRYIQILGRSQIFLHQSVPPTPIIILINAISQQNHSIVVPTFIHVQLKANNTTLQQFKTRNHDLQSYLSPKFNPHAYPLNTSHL